MTRLTIATTTLSLLVAGVFALATAQLAFAHSRPIRFEPAPGSVLAAAPAEVKAWFTSEIRRDANWSFLHVTDAQGQRVDNGETAVGTDRLSMSVPLKTGLGPGQYKVTWRTLDDADGEIFGDCYTFFVGQAAADAAVTAKTRLDAGSSCERIEVSTRNGTPVPGTTPTPVGETEDEHTEGSDSGSDGLPLWTLVIGVGAGIVVGMVGGRALGGKA